MALAVLAVPPALVLVLYRFLPVPATPLMAIRVLDGHGVDASWRRLDDISPHLPRAVIASEDNLFCRHDGFDWDAIDDALRANRAGRRLRRASTLSMQMAKNLFLWPGRDWLRKGLEALLTPQVELILPKRRIMEIYLNIAEWGPGIYGAEAAARHHFGKPASDLTRREAALLAVSLPSPLRYQAGKASGWLTNRARIIERRISSLGPLLDCVDPAASKR